MVSMCNVLTRTGSYQSFFCLYRYLIFYCPMDWVYSFSTLTPIRVVLSAMKEVTRTWKILGGIAQAQDKYEDNLLIMIAIGWAKGQ